MQGFKGMTTGSFHQVSLGVPGGVYLLACLGEVGSGMILHNFLIRQ